MDEHTHHPETRDVWPKALVAFGGGLLVFLAVSALALKFVFDTTPVWPPTGPAAEGSSASPALQRAPESDLAAFRSKEAEELTALGWIDRPAGIARIPIEDAMKLIAQGGLPNWSKDTGAADGECALLGQNVPRVPQLANCRDNASRTEAGP